MKFIPKILLFAFMSTLFISCSNDDEQPLPETSQNILKINNQEFELKTGLYQTSETQDGLFTFGVILYDTEITFSNGQPRPENETFNGIAFQINIDNDQKPEVGEYLFTGEENPGVNAITEAFTISGNAQNSSGQIIEIEVARLQVVENDEIYVFEMTAIDEEDNEIEVNYRGELELIAN